MYMCPTTISSQYVVDRETPWFYTRNQSFFLTLSISSNDQWSYHSSFQFQAYRHVLNIHKIWRRPAILQGLNRVTVVISARFSLMSFTGQTNKRLCIAHEPSKCFTQGCAEWDMPVHLGPVKIGITVFLWHGWCRPDKAASRFSRVPPDKGWYEQFAKTRGSILSGC